LEVKSLILILEFNSNTLALEQAHSGSKARILKGILLGGLAVSRYLYGQIQISIP
jgi:hypothetical protein